MFKQTTVFLSVSVVLAGAPAHAQQQLQEVEVQANKNSLRQATQGGIEQAREAVAQTAGGAGVVDHESFSQGRVSTLSDALGYATGVFIQPRFGAEEARLSIRGSGLQRTFHGRGIRLLQDGIPVNLADGSFDFQAIEALATDYIEVFRGANAFGLGTAGLGGSINYASKTGLTAPGFAARTEAGSFGYLRNAIEVGTAHNNWDAYAAVTQFRQDGFRDFSKQEGEKFIGNVGITINPDVATRFFLASVRSNSELPGNLSLAQVLDYPEAANPGNVSGKNRRDLNVDRLSNRTLVRTALGVWDLNVYASVKSLFHPIFQVIEQDNTDWGGQAKFTTRHALLGLASETTLGVGYSKGVTDNTNRANVGGQPSGPSLDQSQQVAQNRDYFIETRVDLRPGLKGVLGLQWQEAQRRYAGFNTGATPNAFFFDNEYSQLSPRVGLIKTLPSGSQLFANVSGSFEPPSFGELGVSGASAQFTTNNEAQDALSVEGGWRGQNEHWTWDTVAYYAEVENELMATVVPGTAITGTFNAPQTKRLGLELGWSYKCGAWTIRNSTLVNRFRFDGDADFGDNRMAGIPAASTRLALDYPLPKAMVATVSVDAASATQVDHKNTFHAPGYGVLNARLSGKINSKIDWFVDARNLADKNHVATTGVVRLYNPAAPQQFLPGDGRSAFVGVSFTLR